MSTTIKLRYSEIHEQPDNDVLKLSEPAYSFLNGGKLFIGSDQNGTIVPQVIGGKYFTDMLDHTVGTLTPSSALIVDENSKIDQLFIDNISIEDKAITVTEIDGDLTLSANGEGLVKILTDQGLLIASGTESARPSADTIPDGVIRYNTTSNSFEGTVNGSWSGIGGEITDIDGGFF
jgi:hypothetical protein